MEKKQFIYPEAILIEFHNNDIITDSETAGNWIGGEPGDNDED